MSDYSAIRTSVLRWYDQSRRILPWRAVPGHKPDPYQVWLSEVMLQQTTVQAVKPYFEKFLAIWPTVYDLANADREDVMREWAGLGYYSRARNLHKCAQQIVDDCNGVFPSDIKSLKSLSGIGDYTAAAIRSIAFDQPATVIDGNVERVVSRLYQIEKPLPISKPDIRVIAEKLFEGKNTHRPSCFAQGMMDIGATICTPKSPQCSLCPLSKMCMAYEHTNDPSIYPKKQKKKPIPQKHAVAYIYLKDNKVGIEVRPEKGMLGGMTGFPTSEWMDISEDLPHAVDHKFFIKHVFTHFSLNLYPVLIHDEYKNMISVKEIDNLGLPTLFKKLWKIARDRIE
jgi:A/G-specific adenine glycosylase